MNRYDIESRLQRAMSDAVREIVNVTLENTNADTLALMKAKEDKLKKLLQGSVVKGFGEMYAKLAINDVRMEGNISVLDAILDADKVLQATRDEYVFRPAMYKYMIEYADAKTQKDIIKKYLEFVQKKQEVADERSNGKVTLFTENDYDVLAIGYYRLGDRKKSEEYAKKYDERYKLRVADIKETFKDERMQVEIDAEYNRKINELYTKIGMK